MSYLLGPRLHFAGQFEADVSTVNNFVTHFEDPNNPPQPGWNKGGTGSWSLKNCKVTSAVRADGTVAQTAGDDPVVGISLTQNGKARLVDLDPEQQLVSQIWSMQLRLAKPGSEVFSSAFKVAAFSDLWPARLPGGGGDFAMTAFYQSVLMNVVWTDLLGSRVLTELQQASLANLLSIKFNVDGFDQGAHIGRIVGTIGAARAGEPDHFVLGRHCMPISPESPVWYFPAVVDTVRGKLVADFGNALHTNTVGGPLDAGPRLEIGLFPNQQFTSFGKVPIGGAGWYERTGGICEFPADRSLSAAELAQLRATPIAVQEQTTAGPAIVAREGLDGLHVRANNFVYRMSANDQATVTLHASRFGEPLPNADIAVALDPSGLQRDTDDPAVGSPPAGLTFPATVKTNAQGIASLTLSAHSIQQPRVYIDGQVYGVRYRLPNAEYRNRSNFISVLVWTDYPIPVQPTWHDHVEPIFSQYAELYPVMKQNGDIDLGDYNDVVAKKAQVRSVFMRPENDARYMPVTRDLSPAKRQMLLNWLATTGNAGQPNLGTPPVAHAAAAHQPADPGGKTRALQRRKGPTS